MRKKIQREIALAILTRDIYRGKGEAFPEKRIQIKASRFSEYSKKYSPIAASLLATCASTYEDKNNEEVNSIIKELEELIK